MKTLITEGHFARHYAGRAQSRNPAMLDIGQDHALQILHAAGLFEMGLVFKGGTALRKFRIGHQGRFSTDLDFAVNDVGVAELVFETLDGAELDEFQFEVEIEVPQKRAYLRMTTPFGVSNPPSRIDIAHKLPWLPPDILRPIHMPVHDLYNFRLPATAIIAKEELLAEKLARYSRDDLARDLYDLHWFSNKPFDEALVRRLTVMKIWEDITQDHLGERPFKPEHLLRLRKPEEFRQEAIGMLTVPVDIPLWERSVRTRFGFIRNLDTEEQLLAKATLREADLIHGSISRVQANYHPIVEIRDLTPRNA